MASDRRTLRPGVRGAALAFAVWLAGAGFAWAHSGLIRAEPPAESTISHAPDEVKLFFSEGLEPEYSSARVENADGVQVDQQDSRVDQADPLLLRVSLQPLEQGEYTVIWRVLSVDSHVTEGRFTFAVE